MLFDLGIARAVLARETLAEDIAAIKQVGMEVEYFVQGALCICFSGNCYFSSLSSSYSGNRGKCMQLCRKPYTFDGKTGYYLSARDLCLFDKLPELERLGVDAIKIEGRMRSPEYAYTASKVYSSYTDREKAVNALKAVFNRGDFFCGYLDEGAPFKALYPKVQGNIGISVGKINSISGKSVFVSGFKPHPKDGFKILRNGSEVCGGSVRGGSIVTDVICKAGDELRRTFDGALSERIHSAPKRVFPVYVDVSLVQGELPKVTAKFGQSTVTICGDKIVQPAITSALDTDRVMQVFAKVADYPFDPQVKVFADGVFMPVSELNDLRRKTYRTVSDTIISDYKIARSSLSYNGLKFTPFEGKGTLLIIEDERQLSPEILSRVDYVIMNPRDYSDIRLPKIDKPILLNAPITMRGDDRKVIQTAIDDSRIFGVVSNNLYTLDMTDKPILLGIGHNIVGKCDMPHITSVEADTLGNGFVYAYGYAPLMTLCHCPYNKCVHCNGVASISDGERTYRLRKYFEAHCYWQLLNCHPHFLTDSVTDNRVIDGTLCSRAQILSALCGKTDGQFTRGNLNKGLK